MLNVRKHSQNVKQEILATNNVKNKKTIYDAMELDITTFLDDKGWQVYDEHDDIFSSNICSAGLEEIPYKPKFLIEKDNQLFWLYYFWKGDYPKWEGKFQCAITGFDYHKYDFMRGITKMTGIPCAVIFDSEVHKELIFRQLDQLPTPKHSRAPKRDPKWGFNYFEMWKNDPPYYRMLVKNAKFKFKSGMAIWDKSYFGHDTSFQKQLV